MKRIFSFGVLVGCFVFLFPAAGFAFSDVTSSSPFSEAIQYVSGKGYMKGYDDGTFRAGVRVNRAEFLKVAFAGYVGRGLDMGGDVVLTKQSESCFKDVPFDAWYVKYVCAAKKNGFVSGYEDGSFKPGNRVSVVEAAKILVKTYGFSTVDGGDFWYSPFLKVLDDGHVLPATFLYFNQGVTRGELAEMVWRLLKQKGTDVSGSTQQTQSTTQSSLNLPTANVKLLATSECQSSPENMPWDVDMARVRSTWVQWNNDARAKLGLKAYVYNDQLGRTAAVWSENAKSLGYISHKRPGQTVYYDYSRLTAWFKNLGLTFKNIGGSTHTENIGWDYYSCSKTDCTNDLLKAAKGTFNFFMSEKGKASHAHYDSIMSSNFREIGIGVAVDPVKHKYYITIHYGTEITSDPKPVCPA